MGRKLPGDKAAFAPHQVLRYAPPVDASSTSPKVALFSRHYLPYSQTFVFDELTKLSRYQAEVFCGQVENRDSFPFEPVHEGGALFRSTLMSPAFFRRFREQAFALCHAHFGTGGVLALPYAARFGLPLVVTFHGFDVPLLRQAGLITGPHRRYALLGRPVTQRMTLGLCASTELRDMLVDFGVPESKLRIHRLGIDLAQFTPADQATRQAGPNRALAIGRLVEKKGFAYAIRAFAKAASPDDELKIVGEGPLRPELEALAQTLGVADRVHFLGRQSREAIVQLLSETHVLLAPSVVTPSGDRESGLIVVKEAAACGVPSVATRHGGIPDSIDDGETGFLVPEHDVEALSAALTKLFQDRALVHRFGTAARAKMEREFDQLQQVRRLEDFYDEARRLG